MPTSLRSESARTGAWPIVAGLVLQFEKNDVHYCMENSWLFMFGRSKACEQDVDGILTVGDGRLSEALCQDDRFQAIVESPQDSIFFSNHPPEPSVIDFSGPESILYLESGFAGISQIQPGRGQWSLGLSSSLALPLIPNRHYVLDISCRPLLYRSDSGHESDSEPARACEYPMVEREISYLIPFPAEHVQSLNEVRFEYAYAEPPMLHLEGSSDGRPLAVFFRRARITPGDAR